MTTDMINNTIDANRHIPEVITDDISDGFHTFGQLYFQRRNEMSLAEDCHNTPVCKRCEHFKNGVCPFYEETHYIPDVDYEEDNDDSNNV